MAGNAPLGRGSLFFLSDSGALTHSEPFLSGTWSNATTNGNLGTGFLGASSGPLSASRLGAARNLPLEDETNNEEVCKYKALLAKEK